MLTHYILVRRDLPLGVLAAMITHAAGESAVYYQNPEDGRFRNARAVVLEAKNEDALYTASGLFMKHGIAQVQIVESGAVYNGQLMAIGLVPIESETVEAVMRPFQCLKILDKSEEPA